MSLFQRHLEKLKDRYLKESDGVEILPSAYGAESEDLSSIYPLGARLYRPSSAARSLPGIVFIHGGNFQSGSFLDCQRGLLYLASFGYSVVSLEYPLLFKGTYAEAEREISRGIKTILEKGILSSEGLVLYGAGSGAIIALNIGVSKEFKVAGIVLNHPLCSLFDCVSQARPGDRKALLKILMPAEDIETHGYKEKPGTLLPRIAKDLPEVFSLVSDGDYDNLEASLSELNLLSNLGARVRILRERDPLCGYLYNLENPDSLEALSANGSILAFLNSLREERG